MSEARELCAELADTVDELAATGPYRRDAVEAAARALYEPGGAGVPPTCAEAVVLLPRVVAMAAMLGASVAAVARDVREVFAAYGGEDPPCAVPCAADCLCVGKVDD